jgi:hypothetical protein
VTGVLCGQMNACEFGFFPHLVVCGSPCQRIYLAIHLDALLPLKDGEIEFQHCLVNIGPGCENVTAVTNSVVNKYNNTTFISSESHFPLIETK